MRPRTETDDSPTPHRDFPNLSSLVGAYFHQDWDLDDPDEKAVLARFARGESRSLILSVLSELKELLTLRLNEPQLAQLLERLGCYYHPPGAGLTYAEWLKQMAKSLVALLDKKS